MDKTILWTIRITIAVEAGINFVINLLLNGLCAWLLYKDAPAVPTDFWSVAIDTYITCHCICLLVTFFASASARRYFRAGTFQRIPAKGWLNDFPQKPLLLGLLLGGISALVLMPLFGTAFALCGVHMVPAWPYIIFKAIWGGLFGTVICILILRRYLASGR